MENKKTIYVNFVLDKSGSMGSVREATISGFNEYLETLRGDGNNYIFSLTLFDTTIEKRLQRVELAGIKPLDAESYHPDGMTALYDAVCSTISDTKKAVTASDPVLLIVMTDGQENSSKEYTHVEMQKMVKEMEESGNWTFVYMGANQDSWATAQQFGAVTRGNVANHTHSADGVRTAFANLSHSHAAYASSAGTGVQMKATNFFDSNQAQVSAQPDQTNQQQ